MLLALEERSSSIAQPSLTATTAATGGTCHHLRRIPSSKTPPSVETLCDRQGHARPKPSALPGKRYLLPFVSASPHGWLVFGSFGLVCWVHFGCCFQLCCVLELAPLKNWKSIMSCLCCSNDDDMQWASDNAQFMGNNASDIELTRLSVEVGNQHELGDCFIQSVNSSTVPCSKYCYSSKYWYSAFKKRSFLCA
ncbi:hypothetical protein RHGRI_017324 [Rhododendron griersonianum]|uniref:Uncharacterized protein n=1 Tax=Rhododendron griersonianum TaxID=479676 RepID=A0AAV6JXH2_9ERIC|nr:hypothetical protein RHGRI_017324 [Rhododendron griersonianum]